MLALGATSTGATTSQKTVVISGCEAFRSWFDGQPGGKIFSIGPRDAEIGARPSAPDTILAYRWDTVNPSGPEFKQMRFYTVNVGSGRCMAGYYDATSSTALILLLYGTASDLVITRTDSIPAGLPRHSVPVGTKRGAKLGMSIAQIQKIEGHGTMYGKNPAVLVYNQSVKDSYGGTLYGHLAFLFANGKVAAINAGGGH